MLLEGGLLSWDCHIGPYISAFSLVPGPVVVSEFTEGRKEGRRGGGRTGHITSREFKDEEFQRPLNLGDYRSFVLHLPNIF